MGSCLITQNNRSSVAYIIFFVANAYLFKLNHKIKISELQSITIIEKLTNIVYEVLNIYSILSEKEFGFRNVLSMDTALYSLAVEIICAFNNNTHNRGLICDNAKASDCVNHDI